MDMQALDLEVLDLHKAMRADSQRLIRAMDALPADDTQQAAALGRAFAAIVGMRRTRPLAAGPRCRPRRATATR
jgi:hypothetical protein